MTKALPHEIITVVGRTGSGKTQLIARHVGPRHPRRITLDLVGECAALYPSAAHARTLRRVLALMRAFHDKGVERWHIVAALDNREIGQLIRALVPTGQDAAVSLSAAWGGIALEIFELDLVAPVDRSNPDTKDAITTAYARGRHYGLSILAATQRPHRVDRIASSQSSHVVSFSMHEPADLRFLERIGGKRFAQLAHTGLAQYESAWYDARAGRTFKLSADYRTLRELTEDAQPSR